MGASERRMAIMKLLCRRRYETVANIAAEFGVSERTIRRDIEVLSLTEPIYTQAGRYGGGVYVMENYSIDKMYFTAPQASVFLKVYNAVLTEGICNLSHTEIAELKRMAQDYIKPNVSITKENIC